LHFRKKLLTCFLCVIGVQYYGGGTSWRADPWPN